MRSISFFSRPLAAALTLLSLAVAGVACDSEEPIVTSVEPGFAPADSLVIVRGEHLEDILEMRFDGQLVNFNTAFNADQALLFRVPRNVTPAEYTVTLETEGGVASFPFRVSEAAPQIIEIVEEQAALGEVITIAGANFFDDPLQIFFSSGLDENEMQLDSVPGEIVSYTVDTIRARVPDNARSGPIYVFANGGIARSPSPLDIVNALLITDFDGNGLRPDTTDYFVGRITGLDQDRRNLQTFIDLHGDPTPLSGRYLKMSGTRAGQEILGGIRIPRNGEAFGVTTAANNTLLTFVTNNNGRENTFLRIILTDTASQNYDLNTLGIRLDDPAGWVRQAVPLSRFTNGPGVIDPAAIRSIGFFLFDDEGGDPMPMEANIDNVAIAEVL